MAATAQIRRAPCSLAKRSRPRGSAGEDAAGESPGLIASRRRHPALVRKRSGGVQNLFDAADRRRLVDPLDRGEFADETVERRLIDLPLAVGLFRLADITVEVAHYLGDRRRIAGIDLGLVFLGAPAPHRPLRLGASLQLGEGDIHLLAT